MTDEGDLIDRRPSGPDTAALVTDGVIDLARATAVAEAGSPTAVGEYLGALSEDEVAVTLRFGSTDPGYIGWAWSITLAIVEPAHPTVSEVVLLPGDDALIAPRWLPWSERIRPGDIGPGDLLVPIPDDPRLVPAYLQSDDPAVEDVAHELGIGRVQVMSRPGRVDTAERWFDGDFGPSSDMAKAAPATCVMCAFYLPLAGTLGSRFGACGNEMSPADGRIVDLEYGCGAHSEVAVDVSPAPLSDMYIDELVLENHLKPMVTDTDVAQIVVGDDGPAPGAGAADGIVVLSGSVADGASGDLDAPMAQPDAPTPTEPDPMPVAEEPEITGTPARDPGPIDTAEATHTEPTHAESTDAELMDTAEPVETVAPVDLMAADETTESASDDAGN